MPSPLSVIGLGVLWSELLTGGVPRLTKLITPGRFHHTRCGWLANDPRRLTSISGA